MGHPQARFGHDVRAEEEDVHVEHAVGPGSRGTATEVEYWPMPDPSAVEGSRETRLDAYRHTREQVLTRLKARFGIPITPSV